MRMASKSVMGLVSSNGLERYKTTLLGSWLQIDNPKRAGYVPGMILLGLSFPGAIAREDKARFKSSAGAHSLLCAPSPTALKATPSGAKAH